MMKKRRLDESEPEREAELPEEALEQTVGGGRTAAPGGPKPLRPGR